VCPQSVKKEIHGNKEFDIEKYFRWRI